MFVVLSTLIPFLVEKMKSLGTAACPPYHIAIVIGGTSAEKNLLTVKLASTHYYDNLPTSGDETGRAFRDVELEKQLLQEAYKIGLGAQFGGKYMAHDVRVVRLPRHGASCPIGLGVSCSADRNIKCKINADGIWIEKMDDNPGELIPAELRQAGEGEAVKVDLNRPMSEVCKQLSQYPVSTRLSLNGTIIVGRDIAHAKIKARLDAGEGMPQYLKEHPIYYAGPAKTPAGMACGSMGPTTAGRMDPYVDEFQDNGYDISPQTSMILAETLGNDLGKIVNEMSKLFLVLPQGAVLTPEIVEKNIGISKDYNVFELQNAIGRKDVLRCNRIINHFADNPKETPIQMVIPSLYSYFLKIMIYHQLQDKSQAASAMEVPPYFVRDYQQAARCYSLQKLAVIITYLKEADLKSKGIGNAGTVTDGEILKELVFKILH